MSDILNITLTKIGYSLGSEVSIAGIPVNSFK
ncbi:MAG: hypothetical protein U0T61_02010 [Buchnera aphidicola (Melaphis rhois)]